MQRANKPWSRSAARKAVILLSAIVWAAAAGGLFELIGHPSSRLAAVQSAIFWGAWGGFLSGLIISTGCVNTIRRRLLSACIGFITGGLIFGLPSYFFTEKGFGSISGMVLGVFLGYSFQDMYFELQEKGAISVFLHVVSRISIVVFIICFIFIGNISPISLLVVLLSSLVLSRFASKRGKEAESFSRWKIVVFCCIPFFVIASQWGWVFWGERFTVNLHEARVLLPIGEELEAHVRMLSETIGNRSVLTNYIGLNKAQRYLAGQLVKYGYAPIFQTYTTMGKPVTNIIAIKKGTRRSQEVLVVGAHYDSCDNPGANDNASGTAGLLYLARKLSTVSLSRTIHFVFFVNEEPPFFKTTQMGSYVYARQLRKDRKKVIGGIILEMIGKYSDAAFSQRYPPLVGKTMPIAANFIAFISTFHSADFAEEIYQKFRHSSSFPATKNILPLGIPGIDYSDHWSFWQFGYPAVMMTDTAFLRATTYHRQSDTYEKLNYIAMAEVMRGVAEALAKIAHETNS